MYTALNVPRGVSTTAVYFPSASAHLQNLKEAVHSAEGATYFYHPYLTARHGEVYFT
jgi:hypothetical protein